MLCTEWYGPTMSAVMYVEMRGVGSKRQTSSFGSGVGELEITVQPSGACHGELERGLQVRLLEAGEDPARVRHLELRVQVRLLVDRVDEAVQTLTGVGVRAVRDHQQLVPALQQPGQRDPRVREDLGRVQRPAVQGDLVHGGATRSMKLSAPASAESKRTVYGPEGTALLRAAQIQLDLVRVHGEQSRSLLRLLAGQIRARHLVLSLLSRSHDVVVRSSFHDVCARVRVCAPAPLTRAKREGSLRLREAESTASARSARDRAGHPRAPQAGPPTRGRIPAVPAPREARGLATAPRSGERIREAESTAPSRSEGAPHREAVRAHLGEAKRSRRGGTSAERSGATAKRSRGHPLPREMNAG